MSQSRNILVSVSGGRSSHYMAAHIREHPDYVGSNFLFTFANTGKERTETLDFVNQCDQAHQLNVVWLEAKVNPEYRQGTTYNITNYAVASRHGEPFEAMIRKYGIPNQSYPHCTRELKLQPITAYAKAHFKGESYITAIGIRVDEARRIKISSDKCYPLVEWGVNVARVRQWWKEQPFNLVLKDYEGNCDLCWKKSTRKLLTLIKENPKKARWWAQMEEWYGGLRLVSRNNETAMDRVMRFNRRSKPVTEMVKEAEQGGFESVTDPWMDEEQPCACMVQEEDDEQ